MEIKHHKFHGYDDFVDLYREVRHYISPILRLILVGLECPT